MRVSCRLASSGKDRSRRASRVHPWLAAAGFDGPAPSARSDPKSRLASCPVCESSTRVEGAREVSAPTVGRSDLLGACQEARRCPVRRPGRLVPPLTCREGRTVTTMHETGSPEASTPTSTSTSPPPSTPSAAARRRVVPHRPGPATGDCWPGCRASAPSYWSAWRAPAAMGRGPGPLPARQGRTGRRGRPPQPPGAPAARASPIPSTPWRPPERRCRARPSPAQDAERAGGGHPGAARGPGQRPKARARALNQLRSLVSTAPEELRRAAAGLSISELVEQGGRLRPGDDTDVVNADQAGHALPGPAGPRHRRPRWPKINAELRPLVAATAPASSPLHGVGPDTAGALLVAAGDNPGRLRNEATFAHLCGVSPLDASSGQQRPPPAQPRRRPPGQRRPLAHRPRPHGLGPQNPALRRTPQQGRAHQDRDHALPQALRRPRALPMHGRRTDRRRSPHQRRQRRNGTLSRPTPTTPGDHRSLRNSIARDPAASPPTWPHLTIGASQKFRTGPSGPARDTPTGRESGRVRPGTNSGPHLGPHLGPAIRL